MKNILCLSLFSAFFLSACSDRDLDEYQRDKTNKEVQKLSALSGQFAGSLELQSTHEMVGSMQLTLEPQTRITSSNDRALPSTQVFLKAQVRLVQNGALKILSFNDGYFDVSTGRFQANTQVSRRAGSSVQFNLAGQWLSADQVSGTLEIENYPESASRFKVTRMSSEAATSSNVFHRQSHSEDASPDSAPVHKWSGMMMDGTQEIGASTLIFKEQEPATDEDFVETFLPVKLASVSIGFSDKLSITFPNAIYDLRTGHLKGTLASLTPLLGEISLDCVAVNDGEKLIGWNCDYAVVSNGVLLKIKYR